MADEALVRLVQQLLAEGRLPKFAASQIFARYGDGSTCDVCSNRIGANDVLYEVRFGSGEQAETLRMHLGCFLAWDRAR